MLALCLVLWYISGLIGCVLGTAVDHAQGEDFTVSDLVISVFLSMGGLLIFGLGATLYISHAMSYRHSKVLIKGRVK